LPKSPATARRTSPARAIARVEKEIRWDVLRQFCPHVPTGKQGKFLAFQGLEAMYGGAGGGGKSDVGLMSVLQYVDRPGYSALVVRRTLHSLRQPGALLDRANKWLKPTRAYWDGLAGVWRFPGPGSTGAEGATVAFGGLENRKAFDRYASAEFQRIYAEETTQFLEYEFDQFKSRLRRLSFGPLADVPVGIRGGTNPGNIGHAWVKSRFVKQPDTADRMFLLATLADNPYLDRETYEKTLAGLPAKIRLAILKGDWDLSVGAGMFRREWFKMVANRPPASAIARAVRYWDTAATEDTGTNDPDATSGVLLVLTTEGDFYVCDCKRMMATAGTVRKAAEDTAQLDLQWIPRGRYMVAKEQEPGGDSKGVVEEWRKLFARQGIRCVGDKKVANKIERAGLFANAAEVGSVRVVEGEWNEEYLDEQTNFPDGRYKDRVDASSGGYVLLTKGGASNALDAMRAMVEEEKARNPEGGEPGAGQVVI